MDPYFYLVLPAFLFTILAQFLVKSTFQKYDRIKNAEGLTGAETAQLILDRNGITDVRIERVPGHLTDHYDPRNKVLRLSDAVYQKKSLSAVGVAAHEVGHAIQHDRKYVFLGLRSAIYPIAGIGSSFGMPMAIFGIIFSFKPLIQIGIILFAMAVLFYLITLPVEIDASRRAIACIQEEQILDRQEIKGAKKVLRAAAMTYVAAAAVAVAQLLRLLILSRNRD